MSLEQRDKTQILSLAPPLPQRAFTITDYGSTTDQAHWGGSGMDGVRFGYFLLDTSAWATAEGLHTPPVSPGEQFQVYGPTSGTTFPSAPRTSPTGAIDLFSVNDMIKGVAGGSGSITPTYPTVCTVMGTQQNSNGSWYAYYYPNITETITPNTNGIVTLPKPYQPRWFGDIGHVTAVNYTYACPGGPSQLTFSLAIEPNFRDVGMNPGRIIQCFRGGSCIWEGQLTEPTPSATGWDFTANGVGTYGTNFTAYYNTWSSDDPVNQAIGRGLRWKNPGIGNPAGIFLGPAQDSGSFTITDFLNLLCTGGALQWELLPSAGSTSVPADAWTLQLRPMPTDQNGNPLTLGATATNQFTPSEFHRTDTLAAQKRQPPDLYLVNINPIGRTIQADYNTIVLRYQKTADAVATSTTAATTATYGEVIADMPASVALHGRMEYYLDVSNAGTMTAAQAVAIGNNVLSKYVRANFASGFTVGPGQLLNAGGVPVDLGCNWAGKVCTVQNISTPNGGEVGIAPMTFIIGTYQYDDDSQTAVVTPYQTAATDISSIIAMLYPGQFA